MSYFEKSVLLTGGLEVSFSIHIKYLLYFVQSPFSLLFLWDYETADEHVILMKKKQQQILSSFCPSLFS